MSSNFLQSKSYKLRIVYIFFCESILEKFSKQFFIKNKLYNFLALASDKVPNIRIRVANTLFKLKSAIL